MNSMSLAVCLLCFIFSVVLFVDGFRSRKGLYRRISSMAPGSRLTNLAPKITRIRKLPKNVAMSIDFELIEIVEMISALLLAGESLFRAIFRVTQISKSSLSGELRITLNRVELGGEIGSELSALCQRLPTDSVREFSNKLALALSRGTPLAGSLIALSSSLRASNSAELLRRAGANETKMLIPVVLLICPVTVIFALYPSSQFLLLGF